METIELKFKKEKNIVNTEEVLDEGLKIVTITRINDGKRGKKIGRKLVFVCDICGNTKETWYREIKLKLLKMQIVRMCSYKCMGEARKKGGNLYEITKQTMLEKYGVENPSQVEEIKQKKINTSLEHYGVEYPFQAKEVQQRQKETLIKKYGVDNARFLATPDSYQNAWIKQHETKKKNGAYLRRSKIEKNIEKFLKKKYSKVEHSMLINNKEVDIIINDLNLFIQIDGVYWHALDCEDREKLLESNSPRDFKRYNTYIEDRKQDKWFRENKMKLLRIKDTTAKLAINDKIRLFDVINSFLKESDYVKLI